MALCANAGGILPIAQARPRLSMTIPSLVHLTFLRHSPLQLSISAARAPRRSAARIRASAAEEESESADEGTAAELETEESEAETELTASLSEVNDDDEDAPMSREEIKAAYEALYGPASEIRKKSKKALESSGQEEEQKEGRGRGRGRDDSSGPTSRTGGRQSKDGLEESVVQVRRVTKVVKGGKQLAFRVVTVVGDKKGNVGVGVGKAKEVITAVQKSVKDARRHMVVVPMTKYKTFPHRADGHYGAADVMLRPASPGTGVLAGGSVKIVLEMAGIQNALGKQMGGSKNCLNNARATLDAVSQMRHYHEVADLRGIPIQELWK